MNVFPTEKIMNQFNIDWEGPVITEKKFFEQRQNDPMYIGFPWATIIREKTLKSELKAVMTKYINNKNEYYTCCQSIHYLRLIDLFKKLNIRCVYACHYKKKDEDVVNNIIIKPCPLYAISIEDDKRNIIFKGINYLETERKYLYSFVGGYMKHYLSNIRLRIFNLPKKDDNIIINTGDWHFQDIVYRNGNEDFDKTLEYNHILLNSRYILCPSGTGENTIRFWEALGTGSIPILFNDKLYLPDHKLWNEAIIRIEENQLKEIDDILGRISKDKENEMRKNCIRIYNDLKNNYMNVKYISEKKIIRNDFKGGALYISENKENFYQTKHKDNIYLIMQFYINKNPERQKEILDTLKKNITSGLFSKILLLNERLYSMDELSLSIHEYENIEQIVIGRRLQYQDIKIIHQLGLKGYIVMANNDIFFDESIKIIYNGSLYKIKSCYHLTRYEYEEGKTLKNCKLHNGLECSQDSLIIHSKWIDENFDLKGISLGLPGCDNRVSYELYNLEFVLFNVPNRIRSYHNHQSKHREYTQKDRYTGDYLFISCNKNSKSVNKDITLYKNEYRKIIIRNRKKIFNP